jgi:hypothetical protein
MRELHNKGKEMTNIERSCRFHFEENLCKWMDDHVALASRKAHVDSVRAWKDNKL